jgi:hypothetical protein
MKKAKLTVSQNIIILRAQEAGKKSRRDLPGQWGQSSHFLWVEEQVFEP